MLALGLSSFVAGCTSNNAAENHPLSSAPLYNPSILTNPPYARNITNDAAALPAHRISRGEKPKLLAANVPHRYKKFFQADKGEFPDYDKVLYSSIKSHWWKLLDDLPPVDTKGAVLIDFRLLPDGNVSNVTLVRTAVDAKLTAACKQAILDTAPFPPWPPSMRTSIHKDYRAIEFTFNFE